MTNDFSNKQHDDDDKPEAGFEINLPFFKAWGGKDQLKSIMPLLKWLAIGAFAIWGLKELVKVMQ